MNEKLTEEIGKISDTAKTFTDESGKLVLDRFRNPYILTFLISWILFNWKPISFFIFSKGNVEYKIKFIVLHYSDSLHYFFYPFGITMLYLFILPYLNMINEWFVMYSIKNRADYIAKQQIDRIGRNEKIAIADDKMQKAITAAKESTDHNDYVNYLQLTISSLQENLNDERLKTNDLIVDYEEKLKSEREERKKVVDFFEIRQDELSIQLKKAIESVNTYKREVDLIKHQYSSVKSDLEIKKFITSRYKNPRSKILRGIDVEILEHFNDLNEIRFFDLRRRQMISADEAFDFIHNKDLDVYTAEGVKEAINRMNSVVK